MFIQQSPSHVPNTKGPTGVRTFSEISPYESSSKTLRGVTKDSASAPLGSVICRLQNAVNNIVEQTQTSDANGNYLFVAPETSTYQIEAYKAGAPDVVGTTVNTLVPSVGG